MVMNDSLNALCAHDIDTFWYGVHPVEGAVCDCSILNGSFAAGLLSDLIWKGSACLE